MVVHDDDAEREDVDSTCDIFSIVLVPALGTAPSVLADGQLVPSLLQSCAAWPAAVRLEAVTVPLNVPLPALFSKMVVAPPDVMVI